MLHRLRNDFQLALVTLFGACVVFAVAPFAVYRLVTGEFVSGAINFAIVGMTLVVVVFAWVTGRTRAPSIILAVMYSSGVVVQILLVGTAAAYWVFPTLVGNFLLVTRLLAAALSIAVIMVVAVSAQFFGTAVERAAFIASGLVACLLSLIFASRTMAQRDQLERQATHDSLTGVGNRRAMEQELQLAVEGFRRYGTGYGLLVMDLDHFKRVNDRDGHEAGDRALIEFTRVVANCARKVDRLFRFGGEEFVLLVSGRNRGSLYTTAEKVRKHVAENLRCGDDPVTVSIGGAMLQAGEDWREWLRRADNALYRAKDGGRNRVLVDGGTAASPAPGMDSPGRVAAAGGGGTDRAVAGDDRLR